MLELLGHGRLVGGVAGIITGGGHALRDLPHREIGARDPQVGGVIVILHQRLSATPPPARSKRVWPPKWPCIAAACGSTCNLAVSLWLSLNCLTGSVIISIHTKR